MKWNITFIFILIFGFLHAQSGQFIDEIKLKNGYKLRGEIIDFNFDEHLVFQLKGGHILEIPLIHVHKISQKRGGPKLSSPNKFKETGFYNVISGGISFNRTRGYSLSYAIGYRFDRYISLGIGGGLENYDNGEGRRVVPLFLESRGFLFDKKITPYYSIRAGYGIGLKHDEFNITGSSGGLHLNPEIGFRLGGAETVNIFVGVGMKFQNSSFEYRFPWDGSSMIQDHKYRRYMMSVGVLF